MAIQMVGDESASVETEWGDFEAKREREKTEELKRKGLVAVQPTTDHRNAFVLLPILQ